MALHFHLFSLRLHAWSGRVSIFCGLVELHAAPVVLNGANLLKIWIRADILKCVPLGREVIVYKVQALSLRIFTSVGQLGKANSRNLLV